MKIIFVSIIIIISLIILYILLTTTTFTFINKIAIMIVVILIIITIITVYINYNMIKTGGLFNRDADETFDNRTPELEELKLILMRLENKNRKGSEHDINIYSSKTLDDPLLYPDDIKKILQEIDDYVEKNYNKLSNYEKSRNRLLIDTEIVISRWGDQTKREYGIYTYAKSVIDNYLLQLSYDPSGKWETKWEWKLWYPLCFQEILNKLKVFEPGTLESFFEPGDFDAFYNDHFVLF